MLSPDLEVFFLLCRRYQYGMLYPVIGACPVTAD